MFFSIIIQIEIQTKISSKMQKKYMIFLISPELRYLPKKVLIYFSEFGKKKSTCDTFYERWNIKSIFKKVFQDTNITHYITVQFFIQYNVAKDIWQIHKNRKKILQLQKIFLSPSFSLTHSLSLLLLFSPKYQKLRKTRV